MPDPVITVENLSKSYLIGHQGPRERYQSLRDTVAHTTRNFARKAMEMARGKQMLAGDSVEEFWALKDVSFEVKQGEVLGVIGRNGAGKSTLLKILSKITEPTSGRITLRGRVASLLEVGTGFHPELTGRENVFLNGAILGMSRKEIKQKFDEIVDFAGVEKFLDTPVKRYSSGMYVRLAFSVAAHLEPEILVVDEVLAVGDAEFQKKCMGKMQDVAHGGRTVLFVSHNMAAIESLCSHSLVMKNGRSLGVGKTADMVDKYLGDQNIGNISLLTDENRAGLGNIRLRDIKIYNCLNQYNYAIQAGSSITIEFLCENTTSSSIKNVSIGYALSTDRGGLLSIHYSDYDSKSWTLPVGTTRIKTSIECLPLSNGIYEIGCRILAGGNEEDLAYSIAKVQIEGGTYAGNATSPHSGRGPLLLKNTWEVPD